MVGSWRILVTSILGFVTWIFLIFCGLTIMNAECKPTTKQPLALVAHIDGSTFDVGAELRPMVSIVNVSGKSLALEFMKPSIVVPEIWDAISSKRITDAPAYVYDQVCARQTAVLAPNEELSLFSMPILIARQSPHSLRSDHLQAFWATLPGDFTLKYSVSLDTFLPGSAGQIQAKDILITVIDPSKELSGQLCFEQGRGYYLSMGTKGGKGIVWLQASDNKILVGKLAGLVGSQITVSGTLRRMPANKRANTLANRTANTQPNTPVPIPAGELYFSRFQIK